MCSATELKARGLGRKICANALLIILWGCAVPGFNTNSITWETYKNSRYGFEFPRPSNWTELPRPSNDDGTAFVSPQKNSVEIRGWAGNQLQNPTSKDSYTKKSINHNFKTNQGVSGVLVVEVGSLTSSMTLTLQQGQVKYYWQGQSNSQEFDNYYRFFYYIAQQYRIEK